MQNVCMVEKRRHRCYEEVPTKGFRGLRGFRSLPRMELCWPALVSHPEGQNGGTVVPPCDFQCGLAGIAVFIGIPP